jgi:hypothetical protein
MTEILLEHAGYDSQPETACTIVQKRDRQYPADWIFFLGWTLLLVRRTRISDRDEGARGEREVERSEDGGPMYWRGRALHSKLNSRSRLCGRKKVLSEKRSSSGSDVIGYGRRIVP